MNEQRPRVICVGEATIELVRGGDSRFGIGCAGDTFNVAVYLARAGIATAFATALGDDPYSETIVALAAAEGVASDLVLRARGRLPGPQRRRCRLRRRHPPLRLARRGAGARIVRAAGLAPCRRSPGRRQAGLFLRHHAVALLQQRDRPFSRRHRNDPAARREDRLRLQFPPARLARRPAAHAHRVHGGAQARRHRAAGLRRRGGAVGRPQPGGDGRTAAGVRHRRDRGEERPQQRAGGRRRAEASSCRCRRSWCRSMRPPQATASTPPTSPRA